MTLISNVRYQKKRNESDIKLNVQNLKQDNWYRIIQKLLSFSKIILINLNFFFESIEQEDQASHI